MQRAVTPRARQRRGFAAAVVLCVAAFLVEVAMAGISIRSPSQHALLIAASSSESDLPDLEWAETDAARLAATLRDRYGFEVELILGAAATSKDVMGAIYSFVRQAGPGDSLFVHFALPVSEFREQPYLMPYDALPGEPWRSIPIAQILDVFGRSYETKVFLVIEGCSPASAASLYGPSTRQRSDIAEGAASIEILSDCGGRRPERLGRAIEEELRRAAERGRPFTTQELGSRLLKTDMDVSHQARAQRRVGEMTFFPSRSALPEKLSSFIRDKEQSPTRRFLAMREMQRLVAATPGSDRNRMASEASDLLVGVALDPSDDRLLRLRAIRVVPLIRYPGTLDKLARIADEAELPELRSTAIKAMRGVGPEAVPALTQRVSSPDAAVRAASMESLAVLGERDAAPVIAAQLQEEADSEVLRSGLKALRALGGSDEKLVSVAQEALRRDDPAVRREAIQTLATIESEEATRLLARSLTSDEDAAVRFAAAVALGEDVPLGDRSVRALREGLEDEDARVRAASATSLGQGENPHTLVVYDLRLLLRDDDKRVKLAAIQALGNLADSYALEDLEKQLKSEDADIRREAARAIARLDGGSARRAAFRVVLRDPDPTVSAAAREALAERKGEVHQVDELALYHLEVCRQPASQGRFDFLAIENEPACTPDSRLRAIQWLALSDNPKVVTELVNELDTEDQALRSRIRTEIAKLASGSDEAYHAVLESLGFSHPPRTRRVGAEIVAEIQRPDVLDPLAFYSEDRDPGVRAPMVLGLARFAEPLALEKVDRATQDPEPAVQRAAFRALDQQVERLLDLGSEAALDRARLAVERQPTGHRRPPHEMALAHLRYAKALEAHGERDASVVQFEQAMELVSEMGDHPATAEVLVEAAELRAVQGEHSQAETYLLQALRVQSFSLGPQHPATVATLNRLADLAEEADQPTRAASFRRDAKERSFRREQAAEGTR